MSHQGYSNLISVLLAIGYILFAAGSAFAEPAVEFIRSFDAGGNEQLLDVYSVSDGGYVLCGVRANDDLRVPALGDAIVVRTNSDGRLLWEMSLEREGSESYAYSIIETDNGDFMCGGRFDSHFNVFKLNSEGELLWSRDYESGICRGVIELKDDDFVLVGELFANPNRGLLVRINEDGEPEWMESYDPGYHGRLFGVRETDGGVVAGGDGKAFNGQSQRGWALKVNANDGQEIWSHIYSVGQAFAGETISSVGDGGFVLSGYASYPQTTYDFSIIRISSQGNEIWQQQFANDFTQYGRQIVRIPNSGFIIVGESARNNQPVLFDPQVIRSDLDGNLLWQAAYELEMVDQYETGRNSFYSATIGSNSEILACGWVKNGLNDSYDGLLMKLMPDIMVEEYLIINPPDTILTLLEDSRIVFNVSPRNIDPPSIRYEWTYRDTVRSRDTLCTISFDSLGQYELICLLRHSAEALQITWHITVTDLYVSAFTPDTLDLAIRRGTSVDFSLDTIHYTDGEEPEIVWTKTNLSSGQSEETGRDAGATIDFPWSGEYSVEGRATRGESSDAVTWTVAVKGAIWAYVPLMDSLEVAPDSLVHFEVVPTLPEDESLQVAWSVDGELVREGELALDWAFSAPVHSVHSVHCVLSDSVETDSVQWVVTVSDLSTPRESAVAAPSVTALLDVSPNPFNSTLTISYSVASRFIGQTQLAIYDLSGRQVADLLSDETPKSLESASPSQSLWPEARSLTWDASTQPAGVYFVRLQSGSSISTKKVVLMR